MTEKKTPAQVMAKAPKDGKFPEPKTLTYKEMYNIIGKFLQKAIPMKGTKLKIIKGLANRVSSPKPPYVILQVEDEKRYLLLKHAIQINIKLHGLDHK